MFNAEINGEFLENETPEHHEILILNNRLLKELEKSLGINLPMLLSIEKTEELETDLVIEMIHSLQRDKLREQCSLFLQFYYYPNEHITRIL